MNNQEILIRQESDNVLENWREQEKKALELLKTVGDLKFDRSIDCVLFRQDIYDTRPSELLQLHAYAINYTQHKIDIGLSLKIAKAILNFKGLGPAKIDIGKLAIEWLAQNDQIDKIDRFIELQLDDFSMAAPNVIQARDTVLYGFGRIGRLLARRIISQTGRGEQLRLKAIVLRSKMKNRLEELNKRAALLQSDSVHGVFHGVVSVNDLESELIINGNRVKVIFANDPNEVNYLEYGIKDALLIDNTGVWRNRAGLIQHLRPGISKVILTAPGKDIPNIVHGVNHTDLSSESDNIFSAASCTTNAIAPIIKLIDRELGIDRGHIETIHAYTSDQNLLDNFHKKPRRGRGAATNMVLTTTGAAKAVAKVIPKLEGKLTGNAVRVPTPNVSLAILNLSLEKSISREALNELLKNASLHGDLVEQIYYSTSTEYVSSNAIGMTSTSVIDAPSTIVSKDGKNITLYAWYDNEFGYSCQVVRLAKFAASVRRKCYY